jgi:hypothetical protein
MSKYDALTLALNCVEKPQQQKFCDAERVDRSEIWKKKRLSQKN